MATYTELKALAEDKTLLERAAVAVIVAADVVRTEAPTVNNHSFRLAWAGKALTQPQAEGQRALWCALAQNRALTVAQIQAADDTSLQTAINAAIDLLAVS